MRLFNRYCDMIYKFYKSPKYLVLVIILLLHVTNVKGSPKSVKLTNTSVTDSSVDEHSIVTKEISVGSWFNFRWLQRVDQGTNDDACANATSEESFPDDLFTQEQLDNGAVILHFLGGVYSFTLLAVVCNDYFIPAVECICEDLHLSQDVAAATFMAVATSSPELFINVIGTFVTQSDLGIGTIVGSAMFNTLGVGAIGGLAASKPIAIKKWPLIRDSITYSIVVIILVIMSWDDKIEWWECSILVSLYFLYFIFIFNNKKIIKFFGNIFKKQTGKGDFNIDKAEKNSHVDTLFSEENRYTARVSIILSKRRSTRYSNKSKEANSEIDTIPEEEAEDERKLRKSLWRYPADKSKSKQAWFVYTWPIKLLLTCVVPSPKTWRRLYPVTFIMCIVCIGANSYFVSWMITTLGNTMGIPDSIMGMTFLAFGGCLPEACSIFIMSRRGVGGMGVSNSLGANSLAILFSLGIPWFIKSMVLRSQGESGFIKISSSGMDYIILSLIAAVASLYTVLSLGKFHLKKSVGATILMFYFVFIIIAILMESGVFFEVASC